MADEETIRLLEDFLINNEDLENLEKQLDVFNIFDALGAIWVEVRHSDFLAFLLNPIQNHGLGDAFLKKFIQSSISQDQSERSPLRPIDLDLMDLDECLVMREWQNIDILIVEEHERLVVAIENKVGSGEHGDQLKRYRKSVEKHYPGYRQVFLFLTPEGDEPTEDCYIPIDYNIIASLVEQQAKSHSATLKTDVRMMMDHYSQMLRRYIVSDSEIAELCRKIYRKHQRALDLIYEYRPDLQADIQNLLQTLIQQEKHLALDHCTKSYIRFAPSAWDTPLLLQGQGWTRSGRMLMFEFDNFPDRLALYLVIGPGPEETRRRLFELAKEQSQIFTPAFTALGKNFSTIFKRSILSAKVYETASIAGLEPEIRKKWKLFYEQDLPEMMEFIEKQAWIWQE